MIEPFILYGLLSALAIALLTMSGIWLLAKNLKNDGIVDVAWSICIALLAVFYIRTLEGNAFRDLMIAVMALGWGLRLGLFVFIRNWGKDEDPRYQKLKKQWGRKKERKMFYFFLTQGAAAAVFSLPFLLAGHNTDPVIGAQEWAGFFLWGLALTGESLADVQLYQYKSKRAHRGKTCRTGLWRYSRHPNYFFEWLIWCGFALFASGSRYGFTAFLCPILILYFLLKVTGIPKTEEQAVKSRGKDYREYQRTTSMFVPWPPKPAAAKKRKRS